MPNLLSSNYHISRKIVFLRLADQIQTRSLDKSDFHTLMLFWLWNQDFSLYYIAQPSKIEISLRSQVKREIKAPQRLFTPKNNGTQPRNDRSHLLEEEVWYREKHHNGLSLNYTSFHFPARWSRSCYIVSSLAAQWFHLKNGDSISYLLSGSLELNGIVL